MFKKLFCRHKNIKCICNLHGDYINYWSKKGKTYRSVWICEDCGKVIFKEKLEPTCKQVNNFGRY